MDVDGTDRVVVARDVRAGHRLDSPKADRHTASVSDGGGVIVPQRSSGAVPGKTMSEYTAIETLPLSLPLPAQWRDFSSSGPGRQAEAL